MTEQSSQGSGFLADVVGEWEEATTSAADAGIRVINFRIGVIMSPAGGALAKMLLPFKCCLGGRVGDGDQYMSWVSLEDVVEIITFGLLTESLSGPVNAVSPAPVTNREFTKILGQALRRPTILPFALLARPPNDGGNGGGSAAVEHASRAAEAEAGSVPIRARDRDGRSRAYALMRVSYISDYFVEIPPEHPFPMGKIPGSQGDS